MMTCAANPKIHKIFTYLALFPPIFTRLKKKWDISISLLKYIPKGSRTSFVYFACFLANKSVRLVAMVKVLGAAPK